VLLDLCVQHLGEEIRQNDVLVLSAAELADHPLAASKGSVSGTASNVLDRGVAVVCVSLPLSRVDATSPRVPTCLVPKLGKQINATHLVMACLCITQEEQIQELVPDPKYLPRGIVLVDFLDRGPTVCANRAWGRGTPPDHARRACRGARRDFLTRRGRPPDLHRRAGRL
jgi:hypothetical protein